MHFFSEWARSDRYGELRHLNLGWRLQQASGLSDLILVNTHNIIKSNYCNNNLDK